MASGTLVRFRIPMTSDTLNTEQRQQPLPGGCELKFHWRVLGTPAPVFPGFEVDLRSRVPDQEKADALWHRERAKGMLRDHPEIKELFVRTRSTVFWSLLFAGGHIAIALAVMNQPWWAVVLTAYVIGSWIDICLFNLAHEYNHSAVFRRERANRWFFTLMSLPMAQPGHHTWWVEHHIHHNDLGATTDFIKRRRTVLLALKDRIFLFVTKGWLRRATSWITTPLFWPIALFMLVAQVVRAMIGLLVYAVTACVTRKLTPNRLALSILADEHLVPGYERQGFQLWAVWYPALSLTLLGVLAWVGGWQTIAYLMLSAIHDGLPASGDVRLDSQQFPFSRPQTASTDVVLLRLAQLDHVQHWPAHGTS